MSFPRLVWRLLAVLANLARFWFARFSFFFFFPVLLFSSLLLDKVLFVVDGIIMSVGVGSWQGLLMELVFRGVGRGEELVVFVAVDRELIIEGVLKTKPKTSTHGDHSFLFDPSRSCFPLS